MAATFLRKQIIEIFSKCRMFQLICQDSGKTRPRDGDDERNANRKDKSLGSVHGKKVLLNWDVGGHSVAQKIRSLRQESQVRLGKKSRRRLACATLQV